MSTVDIKTESNGGSGVKTSDLSIGKTLNSPGACNSESTQIAVKNSAKATILNQAASTLGDGNVNGTLLSLEAALNMASISAVGLAGGDVAATGASAAFSKATITVIDETASTIIPNRIADGSVSKDNPAFTKMNRFNTSEEEDYKEKYMGFIEKKDSPVKIIVGEEVIDKFFLTSVSYERKEKIQMMAMLDSSDILYLFGDSPTIVSFAGVCLDTKNFQWLKTITKLYTDRMRGTLSVASATTIQVLYDDEIVKGVIINMTTGKNASNLNTGEIRFTMVVTDTMSTALDQSGSAVTTVDTVDITKEAESNVANRAVSSNPVSSKKTAPIKDATSKKPDTKSVTLVSDVIREGTVEDLGGGIIRISEDAIDKLTGRNN